MSRWYVARDGKTQGPYPTEQLQQQVASGLLRPGDLVCAEGNREWKPASTIPGLFPGGEEEFIAPVPTVLSQWLARLSKPMLFGILGALGCLIGAILVEAPYRWLLPGKPKSQVTTKHIKPQVDVIFVLDVTGSMQPAIDGVRQSIGAFVDGLSQRDLDVQVGLTSFRDRVDDLGVTPEDPVSFNFDGMGVTRDLDAFRARVKALEARGGGDPPESALDALVHASRQKYRPDSFRVLVLITDEAPRIPDKEMQSIEQTARQLRANGIRQLRSVIYRGDEAHRQLLRAFNPTEEPRPFLLQEIMQGGSLDPILPRLRDEISTEVVKEKSVKAVQSQEEFAEGSGGRLLLAVCVWTALLALGTALALIIGQKVYLRRPWLDGPALSKGSASILAGLVGGFVAQGFFQLIGGGPAVELFTRLIGWSLLGGLVGAGMALFVPNLRWDRGLAGGVIGGLAGALGFLLVGLIFGSLLGRWIGAAILGFFIGLMVALAEVAFRRWWLQIRYGPREIRTVTLGAIPVTVGSEESSVVVFVRGVAPTVCKYVVEEDQVYLESATGQRTPVGPGHTQTVGSATIQVCSAASAGKVGLSLRLSTGNLLALSEGMPLTPADLPGLQPSGTDGAVAVVARKPSDPTLLLLYNRSRQPWSVSDPANRVVTISPGAGLTLTAGTRINFGLVQATLER